MIELVRPDRATLEAAVAGDDALAAALGHVVAPEWASFRGALERTLAGRTDAAAPVWGTRFFVTPSPRELVGWGGFKGAPRDGVVELGYEIAPGRRERGLATAAVHAMLDEAFADAGVRAVIAHTLAEPNASTRVLEKAGFRQTGTDREGDVEVWRWELARAA